MKKTAALILNRNMPQLADELGDWILKQHAAEVDLYVLENGSDANKYSRYANIILSESLGPAGGVNEGIRQLQGKGYDYIWLNYNDARYEQPGFLPEAISALDQDERIALVFPYWRNNIWLYSRRGPYELVTFSSIIGLVVRCKALEALKNNPRFRLEPLWDSSNFSNHDNIIATLLALYEKNFCAVINRRFTVGELTEPADAASTAARGFTAAEWKHQKGIADVEGWYARAFPELSGTYKEKRAVVIKQIEQLIYQQRLGSVSPIRNKVKNLLRRSHNLSRRLVAFT